MPAPAVAPRLSAESCAEQMTDAMTHAICPIGMQLCALGGELAVVQNIKLNQ